ncbi:MAG: hypothetical protein ACUVXA_20105 [Candidatus Jordarchaeum sp.]|uniref:hypothetical protein n=1 Tax=Candidatus Jordarchaeum sp. TaxID=2823881 RepID=UPI00404928BD
MMEKSKFDRLRALKINTPRWLYFCNLLVIVLSFIGMILAFSSANSIAITAFGLAFIASLSFEVLRSDKK